MAPPPSSSPPTNRPFEWLTSPASLDPILKLVFKEDASSSTPKRIIVHVGSGSSVWGEHIVEHIPVLGYSCQVINVDIHREILNRMEQEWHTRHAADNPNLFERLTFQYMDFVSSTTTMAANSIDCVLDKSTLDCTLCSDQATAGLLYHVYRALRVGGVYVVVSFHDIQLLRPLLMECEGMQWEIQHYVMERHVEDLISRVAGPMKPPSQPVLISSRAEKDMMSCCDDDGSDASYQRRTIQILVLHKVGETSVNRDTLYQHVHAVNNHWFQTQHPLLTGSRRAQLRQDFESQRTLTEAYELLFTDEEREHLTFDLFMEDWHAFASQRPELLSHDTMTIEIALEFVEEMQ